MSLVLDDDPNSPDRSPVSPSRKFDRSGTRSFTKIRTLRPDSPTTIQACLETGVLVSDLRKK